MLLGHVMFSLSPFNAIIDTLRLKSVILQFCLQFYIFFPVSFPALYGLLEHFLEFHFDLSIVFLRVYLYIAFLVVILDITLHILLWSTGVGILPASVKCGNLTSLHIPLCSSISNCLNYFLYLYWEHQIVL